MTKLEHIAVSANNEQQGDQFFVELLGLKKNRVFSIAAEMTRAFFGIEREIRIIRYSSDQLDVEVFLTEDDTHSKDLYTHTCLVIEERDAFENRARSMGLDVIHVPKKGSDTYYLFVKDFFGNIYEIK